ncbi:MAG: hypothetical protein K8T20_13660 [Planctomycetes bacterium]|nr:hypothetical protein [Planctomycetota bacterium]
MLRGFAIGLFVSAALTLVVCKLLDRGGASAEPAPVTAKDEAKGTPGDPVADLARLRTDNEALAKQIADARVALAKTSDPATVVKKDPSGNPWGKLAKDLVAFMKEAKDDPGHQPKRGQEMMMEMFALMGTIAKKYGVTMDEAMLTPDGLPALVMAAFEDADPPLTDAERAALEAATAEATAGWEALQKDKEGKSRLESRLDMMKNGLAAADAMKAALSPGHAETVGTMQAMGMGMSGGMGGGFYSSSGDREKVKTDFSVQWAKTLKLDPSQSAALEPIVDEYLSACDAVTDEWSKSMGSGQKGGESKMMLGKLAAQIAAQKRIAGTVTLTPAQQKALAGWTTTYSYWNQPAPVKVEPKETEK